MVTKETKLVKQPAASTGGESRAGARDARLSRGQQRGHEQTPADKLDKDSRAAANRRGSSCKQQRIFGPSGRLGKYFV